jgi:hypothetical protein
MEAGRLNYAVGKALPVLCLCSDPQQFRYLNDPLRYAGRNILVVGDRKELAEPEAALGGWFIRVEPLAPVTLYRAGAPAIELAVVRGIGFMPRGRTLGISDGHSQKGRTSIAQK